MVPSTNANMLSIVKTHELIEMIAIVRIPAGRSSRRLRDTEQQDVRITPSGALILGIRAVIVTWAPVL